MTLLLAGMVLWLAGCSPPSLQPLFTEQDLVFEPRLLGTWADKEAKVTWALKRSGEKSYDALCTEDGEPHWFKLHLVQLGAYLFLDLEPKDELALKNSFFAAHWVPAHTFFRVRLDGDRLQVAALEEDYLKPLIVSKKTRIGQMLKDAVVLTGSTKELQDWLLKHAEIQEAFTGREEYHRVK
jgi:hypothetical protein